MKFHAIFSLLLTTVLAEQCLVAKAPCAPEPFPKYTMNATLFSQPNFQGESNTIEVAGYYGCVDLSPKFVIQSFKSAPTTLFTLHYGKNCNGKVLYEKQEGSKTVPKTQSCIGSVFIRYHRMGYC